MKKYIAVLALLLFAGYVVAQEIISPLQTNATLQALVKKMPPRKIYKADSVFLTLPFQDDFSDRIGYPNPQLWDGCQAFVNRTYATNPPTTGMVTLDALDEKGSLYIDAAMGSFSADTLMSLPIRLDSIFTPQKRRLTLADSLYLSFYFQPSGSGLYPWAMLGDQPEPKDELTLEFGYPTGGRVFSGEYLYRVDTLHESYTDTIFNPYLNRDELIDGTLDSGDVYAFAYDSVFVPEVKWTEVWSSKGFSAADSLYRTIGDSKFIGFRQVMIPINDDVYLRKGFRFRFRNMASLDQNLTGWGGNVDQWNLDYIVLDKDRSITNTSHEDVAFVSSTPSLLKNYMAMPWNQFVGYQSKELQSSFTNLLVNLSDTRKSTAYKYTLFDEAGNTLSTKDGGNENADPFETVGYVTYAQHANPSVDFTLPEPATDSAAFVLQHVFNAIGAIDSRLENDTFRVRQEFYNYYAYDDGTAENGYGISPEGFVAQGFSLNRRDTLRGISMYFNHVKDDENLVRFRLKVWTEEGGKPGQELYTQTLEKPQLTSLNRFHTYMFNEPVALPAGNFFIGWEQTSDVNLNVGYDRNTDASSHIFYKTGNAWQGTIYMGSLMMRPMLGKAFIPDAIREATPLKVAVYPNPVSDRLQLSLAIEESAQPVNINIYNTAGQRVMSQPYAESINVSHLKPGLYVLQLTGGANAQTKFVKKK